jgi:5'-methylthioadenosine phosphorylase
MLALVGGTGVYQMDGMEAIKRISVSTPFGSPSGAIMKGRFAGRDVLFLARHGEGHRLLPHEINYRANIFALKSLGATQIVGISAVGSLREEIAPGDLAVPTQYFDWTRRRVSTFFGDGIAAHVSTANPVSVNLADWTAGHARHQNIQLHSGVTYACVEGPRLGTRAESHFLRNAGCDLVGMTNVPEVFLAREAQLCYATIGIATDYDCWQEDPAKHVTVSAIFDLYRKSLDKTHALLRAMLQDELPAEESDIRNALAFSMLTPNESLSSAQKEWMAVLRQ